LRMYGHGGNNAVLAASSPEGTLQVCRRRSGFFGRPAHDLCIRPLRDRLRPP
jgi:hypothetical protein